MKWTEHRLKWSNCESCDLCAHRQRVVLAKGRIPCDLLFIGEAPGPSEDSIGEPFCGPAGHLLNDIIKAAQADELRVAFTNLTCCIPRGEDGHKFGEPPPDAIKACAPRLKEFVKMAAPLRIVAVGALATKWLPKLYSDLPCPMADMTHPGNLLRLPVEKKGFAIQKAIVVLNTLVTEDDFLEEMQCRMKKRMKSGKKSKKTAK